MKTDIDYQLEALVEVATELSEEPRDSDGHEWAILRGEPRPCGSCGHPGKGEALAKQCNRCGIVMCVQADTGDLVFFEGDVLRPFRTTKTLGKEFPRHCRGTW